MLNLLLTALTCATGAGDDEDAFSRALAAASPPQVVSLVLRESRRRDGASRTELAAHLSAVGEFGVASAVSILLERAVPPVAPDEAPQVLSDPQRELLLDALATWPAAPALERMEKELEQARDFSRAWAAIHLWSASAPPEHFERSVGLAAQNLGQSKRADNALEQALEHAARRLLRRRPDAFATLTEAYERLDPRLRLPLILGAGATGDARASELLARVLERDPDHASAALAQAQVIGRSHDARVHGELCELLRAHLTSERPNDRSAALRALGAQRDWASVELMIELLEDADETVRRSAEWSLNHSTELSWREPRAWRAWYATESSWRDQRMDEVLRLLLSSSSRQVLSAIEEASRHPLFASQTAPWVADALQSERAEVRSAAARALGSLDSPLAYRSLVDALADPDSAVIHAAHQALGQLSGLELDADPQLWRAALLP